MNRSDQTSDSNSSKTARAAQAAHATVDRAAEVVEDYEERIRQSGEDVQERANDAIAAAQSFIKERPLTSLGLAFLAGALASSLLRR